MFYQPSRRLRGLHLLLLGLFLAMLLAGCSEDISTATPSGERAGAPRQAPTPTETITEPTPVPTIPAPTPAPVAPTVTPLSTPSPLPVTNLTPGAATTPTDLPLPEAGQEPVPVAAGGGSNDGGLSGLKLDDIPRQNGLPKLPVVSPVLSSAGTTPPLKANYGSNNNSKVGIQAGHWLIEALPPELASLRTQTGGSGGGVREVDFNLDLARRVVKLLQAKGLEVDLLPATVPPGYTADAFVSIHADASTAGGPGGFKLARSRFSAIPFTDDALMNSLYATYGKATGLRRDDNITRNMTGYYAFNSRRRTYAVSKVTPAVILETGYLTNSSDLNYLTNHKDQIAGAIADGVMGFLNNRPPLANREKPADIVRGVEIKNENTVALGQPDGPPVAYVAKGSKFEYYETKGDYYVIWLPVLNKPGYVSRADVNQVNLTR